MPIRIELMLPDGLHCIWLHRVVIRMLSTYVVVFCIYITKDLTQITQVLLSSAKIEPNLLDKSGSNALHRAARYDRFNVIEPFIQYYSNQKKSKQVSPLEFKDAFGRTALLVAARRGNARFVRTMLENGADAEAFSNNGLTVMTSAARQGMSMLSSVLSSVV